jgi:hypothetical protein
MAEEPSPEIAEVEPQDDASIAEESSDHDNPQMPVDLGLPDALLERGAKGILREAIQKVMRQISHHEKEAQKHLLQAQELRKDLRESFEFLQERGGKGEASAAEAKSPAVGDAGATIGGKPKRSRTPRKHGSADTKKKR